MDDKSVVCRYHALHKDRHAHVIKAQANLQAGARSRALELSTISDSHTCAWQHMHVCVCTCVLTALSWHVYTQAYKPWHMPFRQRAEVGSSNCPSPSRVA